MLVTLKKTDNDFEHESSSNCRGKGIQNWGRKRRYNEIIKRKIDSNTIVFKQHLFSPS